MTWKCRPDCESDCCGIVPLPKVTVKMFEHLKQRPVKEILEVSDDEIIPFTDDMNCVFLSKDNKCVIYDSRPPVCRDYGIKPELQCPYIKMNGKPRSPAQVKRVQRQINRDINAKMERMKQNLRIKNVNPKDLKL